MGLANSINKCQPTDPYCFFVFFELQTRAHVTHPQALPLALTVNSPSVRVILDISSAYGLQICRFARVLPSFPKIAISHSHSDSLLPSRALRFWSKKDWWRLFPLTCLIYLFLSFLGVIGSTLDSCAMKFRIFFFFFLGASDITYSSVGPRIRQEGGKDVTIETSRIYYYKKYQLHLQVINNKQHRANPLTLAHHD